MIQTHPGIKAVSMQNIDINGGFWYEKQKLVHDVSMWNVYKRFKETGRFDAFHFTWKEGMPNRPHIFWDSDVAKWMEAVAYYCEKQRAPEMEAIVDDVVDAIEEHRMKDGYFNSYFELLEPENRFTRWNDHELYCAGHLLEAAIAYKHATGKDKFFKLMKDYIDLIYQVYYVEKSAAFCFPGHEEIELALVKLYRETGEKKYLDLSLYFVDARGKSDPIDSNIQSHLPVRKQKTAEGHSVRACYLYSAVADLAKETGDSELFDVAETLFNNITRRRMYVTGAIGQTCVWEQFMGDYDLPNQTAYAETCANLALALFARRMSVLNPDAKYADTAELVLYNSFISGMSLDGKSFFYSNMQEYDHVVPTRNYHDGHRIFTPAPQRVEVFSCSCCPPNVVRTVASIADFMYTADENTVWMHQYFASHAAFDGAEIDVATAYPYDETVNITYKGKSQTLALRIPGWCKQYTVCKNGAAVETEKNKGYVYLPVADGDALTLTLSMPVRFVEANPRVWEDAGRVAVACGPIVYCMEGVDHKDIPLRDIRLKRDADYTRVTDETLGVPVLKTTGLVRTWKDDVLYADESDGALCDVSPCDVTLIPYYAIANRGESDMIIWTLLA